MGPYKHEKAGQEPGPCNDAFKTLILTARARDVGNVSVLNLCFPPAWSSPVISRHLFAGILPPIAELRPPPEAVIQLMSVNFPDKNSRP
jgi:hypothetical protein